MIQCIVAACASLVSGLVQGITGFGAVVVLMVFLPAFFPVNVSVGIACTIALAVNIYIMILYREHVSWKKALVPALINIAIVTIATRISTSIDQRAVKPYFGAFLILLALYFLFFSKKTGKIKINAPVSILIAVAAAVCEGFFGVGGPLMVIYFLNKTDSKEEYLGTIQAYYILSSAVNTAVRFASGVLQPVHIPVLASGIAAILIGGYIAKKIVAKIDPAVVTKVTYIMIGVAGVINLLS